MRGALTVPTAIACLPSLRTALTEPSIQKEKQNERASRLVPCFFSGASHPPVRTGPSGPRRRARIIVARPVGESSAPRSRVCV
ncbi:hypothetical protein AURDEDRAFT_112197 [Auricularia subglabra TFB-10046 SS5]|nr:hypothetical protein AURDEDRAFT_112197 [Auricularia subglabra TFB-10046 SS5]